MKSKKLNIVFIILTVITVLFSFFPHTTLAEEKIKTQIILPQPSLNANGLEDFYYNISSSSVTTQDHPLWKTKQTTECKEKPDFDSNTLKTLNADTILEISYEVAGYPLLQNPIGIPWLQVFESEDPDQKRCFILAKPENIKPINMK